MARAILLVGAVTWLVGGAAAVGIAILAAPQLERLLPPLAIDTDALRGAILALGAGLLVVAGAHLGVIPALRTRWGSVAAILLAALLAATLIGLSAAAATSAVATPDRAPVLLGAAAMAALGAIGYGLVVLRLVAERTSRTAS